MRAIQRESISLIWMSGSKCLFCRIIEISSSARCRCDDKQQSLGLIRSLGCQEFRVYLCDCWRRFQQSYWLVTVFEGVNGCSYEQQRAQPSQTFKNLANEQAMHTCTMATWIRRLYATIKLLTRIPFKLRVQILLCPQTLHGDLYIFLRQKG